MSPKYESTPSLEKGISSDLPQIGYLTLTLT